MDEPASQPGQWFRSVVARYEGPLVRYANRITGDLERARDVVQDVFLRLHRENGSGPANVQAWLFTVCRRRALDVIRKERRMKTLDDSQAAECESAGAAQPAVLERQESQATLIRTLAILPIEQQEVVRLKFQEGLSYRDIAEITGLSTSNVGYLIHQAIKRLREHFKTNPAN